MLQRGMLLVVGSVMVTIESSALTVRWLKISSLRIWENMIIGKLVFQLMNVVDVVADEVDRYLEGVRSAMRYRNWYESVTGPMKKYYKELRNKHSK